MADPEHGSEGGQQQGQGETVSRIRNLAVSGPHIAKFTSFLKSPCRNQVAEFPKYFCITFDMSMVSPLHNGHLAVVMSMSPSVKGEPGTHHIISKPVYHSTPMPHRLPNFVGTLRRIKAELGFHCTSEHWT